MLPPLGMPSQKLEFFVHSFKSMPALQQAAQPAAPVRRRTLASSTNSSLTTLLIALGPNLATRSSFLYHTWHVSHAFNCALLRVNLWIPFNSFIPGQRIIVHYHRPRTPFSNPSLPTCSVVVPPLPRPRER